MSVITFEENRATGEEFIQIFLVRERLGTEHSVVPAAAKDPVVPRTLSGILPQSFLNVGGVLKALEIHAPQTEGAIQEMNVAVDNARKHKLSAGVDDLGTHAAPTLNFGIVSNGNDFSAVNRHGLSPWLLGIFGVNVSVNDDDVRRFYDPALRASEGGDTEQEQKSLKKEAKRASFHRHLVLRIRMLAAC